MIHVIGDSHTAIFSNTDTMIEVWSRENRNDFNSNSKYFKVYRIGTTTATGILEHRPKINDVITYAPIDKVNDKILFVFGEVDIRNHIMRLVHSKGAHTNMECIKAVNEYFKTIFYYKGLGFNVMVWGVIASHNGGYNGPSYGSNVERNKATKFFNDYLEVLCDEQNIPFISVFYQMVDDEFNTKQTWLEEWRGSHLHINPNKYNYIESLFKKKNLI